MAIYETIYVYYFKKSYDVLRKLHINNLIYTSWVIEQESS